MKKALLYTLLFVLLTIVVFFALIFALPFLIWSDSEMGAQQNNIFDSYPLCRTENTGTENRINKLWRNKRVE